MGAVASTSFQVFESDTGVTQIANSPFGYKEILVFTDDTVDDTDTIAIKLADYGITTFKYIKGFQHSTEGAVIIPEAPTTAVAAGVLTITVGGSTDNKCRAFIVGGL
jgi:hypothetical protein